jgi:hypothetical protein
MLPLFCAILLLAPPPDTNALVESVIAHERAELAKRQQYTHREQIVKHHFGKDGKETSTSSETWEVLFFEGAPYRKLIAENDMPLSAAKQAKVEKEMAKEKQRRAGEKRNGLLHRTVSLGGIAQLPKFYNVKVTEDSFDGRPVWKIDAEPRPGVPAETEKERNAAATRRIYWIDPEANAIVKDETEFLLAINNIQPGTILRTEYQKVNSDCWLPAHSTFKWGLAVAKVVKASGLTENTFSDYKKFNVDSSVVFDVVSEPVK